MRKILFAASLILFANLLNAQDLSGNWSEKEIYSNKTTGFFDEFVGGNSKYVYARCSKVPGISFKGKSSKAGEKKSKINLIAYDKATMKEVASVTIIDLSGNDSKKYADLRYYKTIVFENTLYVFWVTDNKTKDELFVASYDSKLKKVNALKKIYELSSSKGDLRKAELFVWGNQKAGEKIIIGGELATDEGQNIKMEYKVLNADFTFAAANQVTLPVIAIKNKIIGRYGWQSRGSDALSSKYEFGDDGNLHLKTMVVPTKEEEKNDKKDSKKSAAKSYAIYSIIDVKAGKIHSFNMKADDKNILDFGFKATKNSIKIFGFFNDVNKGGAFNGIFSGSVDPKAYTISSLSFTYFTKDQLATLFAKDKEDVNKAGIFASKKKKEEVTETLSSNYGIENVQSLDKDNLVLICSKMLNYTRTYTDSKGNTHNVPYCDKDNITAFKLNTKGNIVWASNLDRKITYPGWDIHDVEVINKDKSFYVAYGNSFNSTEKENGKTKKTKKSKDQRTDRFEYAVIDYNTGAIQRKEFKVNAINAQKEDIKKMDIFKMDVIDNQFYVNSTIGRLKPLPTILSFIGCFVCPPLVFGPFIAPSYKKWICYNGKIAPMK